MSAPMSAPFTFARAGRSVKAAVLLAAIYAALAFALVQLQAAPWIVALLVLPTLPALWDLIANPSAGLTLTDDRLDWHSGRRRGSIPLAEIDRVRFERRWDMSMRIRVVPKSGPPVQLPPESLPRWQVLERAFSEHGIDTERHHFAPF